MKNNYDTDHIRSLVRRDCVHREVYPDPAISRTVALALNPCKYLYKERVSSQSRKYHLTSIEHTG